MNQQTNPEPRTADTTEKTPTAKRNRQKKGHYYPKRNPTKARRDQTVQTTSNCQTTPSTTGGGAQGEATGNAEPSTQEHRNDAEIRKLNEHELVFLQRILYDRMIELGMPHKHVLEYVTGITPETAVEGVSMPDTFEKARQMLIEGLTARRQRVEFHTQLETITSKLIAAYNRHDTTRQQVERRNETKQEIKCLEAERREAIGRLDEAKWQETAHLEQYRKGTSREAHKEPKDNSEPRHRTTEHRDITTGYLTGDNTNTHMQSDTGLGITHMRTSDTQSVPYTPSPGQEFASPNPMLAADGGCMEDACWNCFQTTHPRHKCPFNRRAKLCMTCGNRRRADPHDVTTCRRQPAIGRDGLTQWCRVTQAMIEEPKWRGHPGYVMRRNPRKDTRQQLDRTIQDLMAELRQLKMTQPSTQHRSLEEAERVELEELKTAVANQRAQDAAIQRTLARRIAQIEERTTTTRREQEVTGKTLHNVQDRFQHTMTHDPSTHGQRGTCPHFTCRKCVEQDNVDLLANISLEYTQRWPSAPPDRHRNETNSGQTERTRYTGRNSYHPETDTSDEEMNYTN